MTVQRVKLVIRLDSNKTEMLEISDKKFKIIMVSNLKALKGKVHVSRSSRPLPFSEMQ